MHSQFPLVHVLIFTIACLAYGSPVSANDDLSVVSRTFKGERLNELGIWQLGPQESYEIYVTSVAGNAACYRADNLKPIWEQEITENALTAPVIGDFTGSGSPILAFASEQGEIYFLWPGSGEIIATLKTDLSFSLPPSVAVTAEGDYLALGDEQGHIALARLNAETGEGVLINTISNTLPGRNDFSLRGSFTQSPTCADIDGDGNPEIITVNDSGVLQIVSTGGEGLEAKRYYTRLAQQSRATTLLSVGDLQGTGRNIIALGVDASIHLYRWDPEQDGDKAIQLLVQGPAYGSSTGHLLIGQINADSTPDLLSTANNTIAARYLGSDLNGNQALLDIPQRHLTTTAPPFSPAVALTKAGNGEAVVLSVDNSGTAWTWEPASNEDDPWLRFSDVPVPSSFTPAGDLTNSDKLSIVTWDQQAFKLSVVTFPIELPAGTAPILTAGGNYSRNGQWGATWINAWNSTIADAASSLEQAKRRVEESPDDTDSPNDPVSIIAGLDPDHPIAEHFRKRHAKTSVAEVALIGGLMLAFMLVAGYVIIKLRRH